MSDRLIAASFEALRMCIERIDARKDDKFRIQALELLAGIEGEHKYPKHPRKFFILRNVLRLLELAEAKVAKVFLSYECQDAADKKPKQLKGVFIRFKNGVKLSVQWAAFNYCDKGFETCEIMAMDELGYSLCIPNHLSPLDYDQVIGHVDKDKLQLIMQECSNMKVRIRKEVGCSASAE